MYLDDGAAAHHDSLGWTYLRMGEPAKAKRAFDAAIKLTALPIALYGRGLALLQLNDSTSGERDLAADRELSPQIDEDVRKEGFEFADSLLRPKTSGNRRVSLTASADDAGVRG